MTDAFETWVAELAAELGLDDDIPSDELLKIARVVAHRIDRRGAPITSYMLGLAVGKAGASSEAVASTLEKADELARSKPERDPD